MKSGIQIYIVGRLIIKVTFTLLALLVSSCENEEVPEVVANEETIQPVNQCDFSNRTELNTLLIEIETLPEPRYGSATVTAGNKIFFAGGFDKSASGLSSRVDIYDITSQSWSTAQLSLARSFITAIAGNTKVIFAGGEIGDGTLPVDNVDIFDLETNTWTTAHLSASGYGMAATVVGSKILIARGDSGFSGSDRAFRVDIFDETSSTWTTANFSEYRRDGVAAVTLGDKAYFAGGEATPQLNSNGYFSITDKIDIYDNTTNMWSKKTMYESKYGFAGIAMNNKIYWAGGKNGSYPILQPSSLVEIWDPNTNSSTLDCLLHAGYCKAVQLADKIVFFTYDWGFPSVSFDIFDTVNNKWYYSTLPFQNFDPNAIFTVNHTIYVIKPSEDGNQNYGIYTLEFNGL